MLLTQGAVSFFPPPTLWGGSAQEQPRCLPSNLAAPSYDNRGVAYRTIGRNEEMIGAYIRNKVMADKQLDQLQLKLSSS